VDADVRAGLDPVVLQMVSDAVRALLEVRIGVAAVAADQRLPLGDGVDHGLEHVGDVPLHLR
jgi:hypothetical protein